MADELVSRVLEKLASIMVQEVRFVVDVKKDVRKITSNLQAIQALLADAEKRCLKEAAIRTWLDKLKHISYDMDDVLDLWSTAILKSQIEKRNQDKWLCSFIRSSCFSCRKVGLRHDIAIKIKQLNERLDDIAMEKDRYNLVSINGCQQVERLITTSMIDVAEVKGREEDKNAIITMLCGACGETSGLQTISIVGMGGLGKTALAQLVYNDDKVKAYFEKRVWVCVSDPFDEIRIAKAILESLSEAAPNLGELQSILEQIQQSVRGKRFLLVLDDVWTEDSRQIEQIKRALKCGSSRCAILVTTRKENVARIMGCTVCSTVHLGKLSTNECWSVFSQVAFFGRTSEEIEELEEIGSEIVKKCKGLPLAAKTLGGLLQFKKSREEWQSVLDSEVWQLEEPKIERDLFAPLWLSYYDLSPVLRRCFLYCAIFPKDHMIEKDKLIKLWMAQGYLHETERTDMETVGEGYFHNLCVRSLFQDFAKDKDGKIKEVMIHDIVHDFAQFLTKQECFCVKVNRFKEQGVDSLNQEARHSLVLARGITSFPDESFHSLKMLRSLLISGEDFSWIQIDLRGLFNHLTCLRSLELSNCYIMEIPSTISRLVHLRHLDLSWNRELKGLPETVSELLNLQTFNLHGCKMLLKLPPGLGKLVNLRHLYTQGFYNYHYFIPKGIGRLTCLRTLENFFVGHDPQEAASLEDLKNLNYLQGFLSINKLGKLADVNGAKQAQLMRKKRLLGLTLRFDVEEPEWRKIHDQELLEALELPPNLEKLKITHYKGTGLDFKWAMLLTHLKRVELENCVNCEHLPSLGKLPALEYLTVEGMVAVRKVGDEFLGLQNGENAMSSSVIAFPKLKTLALGEMVKWEQWDLTRTITVMPCITHLSLYRCHNLKELPDNLLQKTTLKYLEIHSCSALEEHYHEPINQYKISHIPNINIDGCFEE